MRPLVFLALLLAALGQVAPGPASSFRAVLRVTYWKDGSNPGERQTWTLRCAPPRGSLPRPVVACNRLAAGGRELFAPVPPQTACSQIYGGPQRARVVGVVSGRRIWTTFTLADGCEIARWNRLSPWLLPPGGVPG